MTERSYGVKKAFYIGLIVLALIMRCRSTTFTQLHENLHLAIFEGQNIHAVQTTYNTVKFSKADYAGTIGAYWGEAVIYTGLYVLGAVVYPLSGFGIGLVTGVFFDALNGYDFNEGVLKYWPDKWRPNRVWWCLLVGGLVLFQWYRVIRWLVTPYEKWLRRKYR